ncbi:hypothetical protein BZG73_02965 [Salinivibrio siamensis]|uniref:Lipoprotein n=2 Tax=Salinivibrio siamensis TaxID=414286 RepID=A0ABX3KE11_9GAMM|nr:hypothetical protein BZG73_02965 [Salinivibrio siamensis]
MRLITALAMLMAIASCSTQAKYSDEVMYDMASILKDVSQAIDGELKWGNTEGLSQEEIISNATLTNPNQLPELEVLAQEAKVTNYRLLQEFQGGNAVMLICDGDVALMEDAGCNAEFDKIYWKSPRPNTCSINLDAVALCSN